MAHSILLTGADRRRFWSDEDRRKILTEAFAPGAVTAAVARRYEVSSGLLYTWRRKAQCWENGPRFLRALVDDGGPLPEDPKLSSEPAIVVELPGGVRVSIGASASDHLIAATLQGLR